MQTAVKQFPLLEQILQRDRTQESPLPVSKEQLEGLFPFSFNEYVASISSSKKDLPKHIPRMIESGMEGKSFKEIVFPSVPNRQAVLEAAAHAASEYSQRVEDLFESTYLIMESTTQENLADSIRKLNGINETICDVVSGYEKDQRIKDGLAIYKLAAQLNRGTQTRELIRGMMWAIKGIPGTVINLFLTLKIARAEALMAVNPELAAEYVAAPLTYLKREVDWESLHDGGQDTRPESNVVYLLADKDNHIFTTLVDKLAMKKKEVRHREEKSVVPSAPSLRAHQEEEPKEIDPRAALYDALTGSSAGVKLKPGFCNRARSLAYKLAPAQARMLLPAFTNGTGLYLPRLMKIKPLRGKRQYDYLRWIEGHGLHGEQLTKRMARAEYQRLLRS